jgi:uncharacterized membrane protein YgdD (TMEM256/DUF423 family)
MSAPALVLVALAGLYGAAGIALWAAAAHGAPGASLATGAQFLLIHATALVAIAVLASSRFGAPRLALGAGVVLAIGASLFSGDIAVRAFWQQPLFAMAAPAGGTLTIVGWLLLALAALVAARA